MSKADARIDLIFTMSDNRTAGTNRPRQCKTLARTCVLRICGRAPRLVEPDGIEPTTSCLQSRRSPN